MDNILRTDSVEFEFPEFKIVYEDGVWRASHLYEDEGDDQILEDKKNSIEFTEDVEIFGDVFILTLEHFNELKKTVGV
jgi:hypothetical protein